MLIRSIRPQSLAVFRALYANVIKMPKTNTQPAIGADSTKVKPKDCQECASAEPSEAISER